MIRNDFDPQQPYRYVCYGRMSDPKNQNIRSPDQQFAEITRTLERLQYPWQHVKDYRDGGTGRRFFGRPELQRMLHELKSGIVTADLILVDTPERFGRLDGLEGIRRDLYNHHGLMVLSANTNFGDPNTPQGRAYGAVDGIRASEEGRVKALHVLRGKRDAILLGRWPGGPVPTGHQLQEVVEQFNGRTIVYNILVPDPDTSWVVALAFEIAQREGWGATRVARAVNVDSRIRAKNIKFSASTVGGWLKNPLHCGAFIWPKVATDIIDDCRVVQPVPDEEKIHVPDYCEPIVPVEVYQAVAATRQKRAVAKKQSLSAQQESAEKLIKAPAPGLALNYPLSGLVICDECGRSMTPRSSPRYITKQGVEKRYTKYQCPGYPIECENAQTVPEEWLREKVISILRQRLQLDS